MTPAGIRGFDSRAGPSMKIVVESKDQIVEKKADGRGRVTVGSEYAGKEVQLAVLEVREDDDT